jgi:hypothetical protein
MRASAARTALAAAGLCAWAACGGSSSTPASASLTGTTAPAAPSPSPSATPTPAPASTPTPAPTEAPELTDNDRPVDHIGAGLYYIDCNGEPVPNSRNAKEVPTGCRAHIDATPKDDLNVPTNPRYEPQWVYSSPDAIIIQGSNPYGPILTARRPHVQKIYLKVDGVESNTVSLTFH